jgi:hypothetical protein
MTAAAEENARINQLLAAIPADRIGTVNALYSNARKELGIALAIVFFMGSIGVHKIF